MNEFKRFLVNMIVFITSLPVVILLLLIALWVAVLNPIIGLLVNSNFKPYGWLDKMNDFYHFLKNGL